MNFGINIQQLTKSPNESVLERVFKNSARVQVKSAIGTGISSKLKRHKMIYVCL